MKIDDVIIAAFKASIEAKATALAVKDVLLDKHPELKSEFNAAIEKHTKHLTFEHSQALGVKPPTT